MGSATTTTRPTDTPTPATPVQVAPPAGGAPEEVAPGLTIARRPDGVAVLRLDVPGEPVNTLKPDFAPAFGQALDRLERDGRVRAVVLASGKPDSFVAGADIDMLAKVTRPEEGADLSRQGQRVMDRIAASPKPFVAAIHGACLGGGLELALACHGRVASDARKTKLGLPEVMLGLLPGAGGTQRLPALVGVQAALDLMLTGRQLDGRRAKKLGLVCEVVPPPIVEEVACARALALADAGRASGPARSLFSREGLTEAALAGNPLGRRVLFQKAREALLAKSQGNYPAPEKILDVVRTGLAQGQRAGLEAEAQAFGALCVSPEARALISIYHATQALKKDNGTGDPSVVARPVTKVGVLGAGLMGSGVAAVTCDGAGLHVRLKDRDPKAVGHGLAKVRGGLDQKVKRRRMTALDRDQVWGRVSGTTTYAGFQGCEVVIEAVFEDLGLKHKMIADVEAACPPTTIFASNTSSIPIGKLAAASKRPAQVIGMHYFSPVEKMPLLEVIVHDGTAPEVTATCVALGKQQGKTVIVVRDGPGFYTTRILAPYMNEAAWLLAEGVAIDALDRALVKFGFPVGPITLMDEVGIDVGEKVGKILLEAFGARFTPPAGIEKLIADGRLGRKNGRGFYRYDPPAAGDGKGDGKKKKPQGEGAKPVDESVYALLGVKPTRREPDEAWAWRCTLMLVNEAVRCFEEGILRSARDGDVGAIFGLGFPPFRGGPFRLVDALGAAEVVRRLEALARAHGPRFEPAALLRSMAAAGQTFHGDGNRVAPPEGRRHPVPG